MSSFSFVCLPSLTIHEIVSSAWSAVVSFHCILYFSHWGFQHFSLFLFQTVSFLAGDFLPCCSFFFFFNSNAHFLKQFADSLFYQLASRRSWIKSLLYLFVPSFRPLSFLPENFWNLICLFLPVWNVVVKELWSERRWVALLFHVCYNGASVGLDSSFVSWERRVFVFLQPALEA